MNSTKTEEELEEKVHTRLMIGLSNLKQNFEIYLTDEFLPVFYSRYISRCKENKIEYIFTFEQYVQNSREYILKYHAICYEFDIQIYNKTLPPWKEIRGKKKEKNSYYAIYQDIINLAEKGPPSLEISEKGIIMIEGIGVRPKVASIIDYMK